MNALADSRRDRDEGTVARRPRALRPKIARLLGNWPITLHRLGLGRLVGSRYAVVCTIGRRTGAERRAAVMVLREDRETGEIAVAAGSRDSHWFRNIQARPATEIWLGGRRFRPCQRMLDAAEIAELLVSIRRRCPREARVQAAFFGWPWPASPDEIAALAATLGGVSFRPAREGSKGQRDCPSA